MTMVTWGWNGQSENDYEVTYIRHVL